MTKTQISIRVSPDTLAAVDAAAGPRQRSATIEAWLAAQAKAQAANAGQWRKVHELLEQADDCVTEVDNGYAPPTRLVAAISCLIRAISAINDAGTAPE